MHVYTTDRSSFYPLSCFSSALAAFTIRTVSLEFLPIILSAEKEVNGKLLRRSCTILSLTVNQDSVDLCAAVLDNDRRSMDTLEDPQH